MLLERMHFVLLHLYFATHQDCVAVSGRVPILPYEVETCQPLAEEVY